MHRVKAKTDAEKDKKQSIQSQKRTISEDKLSKPTARRRSSQRGINPTLPLSPTAISPRAPVPILSTTTESPTNTFTPVHNSAQSFTPQSGSGSSPGTSELIYPFSLTTQGIYTPFGNSPPLFPVGAAGQAPVTQAEMMDVNRDDDSGHFWQSLFGPPGSSLQPPQAFSGFVQPFVAQGVSPERATGEFRDPNDVDMGETAGLDDVDTGLVDWGDFIAQCSQVWVTE
jgi:hypothetical protein